MRWAHSVGAQGRSSAGYVSGGRASSKQGMSSDSQGVRLISTHAGKLEDATKDELEHEALFASRRDKVLQVTLPRFSWTDERGWPK